MSLFSDDSVRLDLLRKHAKNKQAALPEDVIPLFAADPDFQVAPEISEAIINFAKDGVFSYGESWGNKDFREVISNTVRARKNLQCNPDDIMVTSGVAQAMMITAKYACKPGDEAILFDPVDLLFGNAIDYAGGIRKYSPVDKRTRKFDIDGLNELITSKTRMLCICNPHNPLGRVLSESELRSMAEVAVENNLIIMSDEIWSDIVFDGRKHISTASLSSEIADRTVSLYGFSKTFAMAGLHLGFAVATNPEIMNGLKKVAPGSFFVVDNISQEAGKAAYSKAWYWADAFLNHLQKNRDLAYKRFNEMRNIWSNKPEGTYGIFPDISSFGMSSEEMAEYMLTNAKVAIVPGHGKKVSYFGPGAEGNIRLVFCTSTGILSEALNRIETALSKLKV